jgi:TrmH family RNA methyltransferase
MGKLRIVLVEPREAGNVGAAARTMKNFGFSDLVLVGQLPPLHPVAEWWASGAEDLVEASRRVATLAEAVADAHRTVATTSAREREFEPLLDAAGVAELLSRLEEDQTLALVFGREDRGLTAREIAFCHQQAAVPTSKAFPTLNLAQSVAVFCYEAAKRSSQRPASTARELANAEMLERLHQRARELLVEVGFLQTSNPDRIYDDLRAMAGRASLDEREATILLGIIRQLEWKLGR